MMFRHSVSKALHTSSMLIPLVALIFKNRMLVILLQLNQTISSKEILSIVFLNHATFSD